MAIVAHAHPFIVGVDAHARTHTLVILACPHGEVIDEDSSPAPPQDCSVLWTGLDVAPAVTWARCG